MIHKGQVNNRKPEKKLEVNNTVLKNQYKQEHPEK